MTDYAIVMSRLYPDRQWVLNGDDYDGLVMLDGGNKPTKKTLDDSWPQIKNEIENEKRNNDIARQSALAKLAALGLTDEEIKALVG